MKIPCRPLAAPSLWNIVPRSEDAPVDIDLFAPERRIAVAMMIGTGWHWLVAISNG